MSRPDLARTTPEVLTALREGGHLPEEDVPPEVPEGYVRYFLAVGDSRQDGIAPPAVVAALLRAFANAIDPPRPAIR